MKVSTTSFLLASLYGSALAAPVSGDLVGGALKGVTSPAGLGNVVPGNGLTKGLTGAVGQPGSVVRRAAPIGGDLVGGALKGVTSPAGLGNIVPGNGLTKGLTGAVGQPGRVVGRDAPIGGALQSVTGTTGLGNVVPGNDLAKGLTSAVGQPGSIAGRDGEQKATAVLPNGQLVATDNTADVDIRADAPNVYARNVDAKAKGIVGQLVDTDAKAKAQPFAHPPADVNVDGNVDARNLDAKAKGVVGQLVDSDAHAKVHPFAKPPVDVNAVADVDARSVDAKPTSIGDQPADPSGVALDDDTAQATGSAEFAGETGNGVAVSSPTGWRVQPTGNL